MCKFWRGVWDWWVCCSFLGFLLVLMRCPEFGVGSEVWCGIGVLVFVSCGV